MLKKTYIKILMERRVPHIIGSYIVAGTSLVLFLDWLSVRYEYPEYYISLALFGIISIMPSVIILAYFHGAPGKDEWTKIERIGVPINILFIAIMVFFIDWTSDISIQNSGQEKIDSYYINITSTDNYIDDLYYRYDEFDTQIDTNTYSIRSIDDDLLKKIKKECFNYLNVKFQNKGIDIYSNINPSHITTLDSLPYPHITKFDTTSGINIVPYPVNELSKILNVEENNIPKVFVDILVYIAKDLNSGKEKIFYAMWGRIRAHGNLSGPSSQWYDNNKSGYTDFIKNLKERLLNGIDQISFSKSAYQRWIGEIEEILPNDIVKVKLYDSNNIKSNLQLDAQTMYSYTINGDYGDTLVTVHVDGLNQLIEEIQLGITYINENKSEIPDSLFEDIYELEENLIYSQNILDSLIKNKIHKPGTNMVRNLGYSIEVIDVYEYHAICNLLKKDKPWKRIKVGHRLRIHE